MTPNIKYIRLYSGEEIVAEVTELEDAWTVKNPLIVEVETFMEEGRQLLYMKEYLPQSVVSVTEVNLLKELIAFVVPVTEEFLEQYNQATEYFYNSKEFKQVVKKKKVSSDETSKVVSLFEAMMDKKDKPTH
jgi:uncharacterized protein (DUF1330 family)